MSKKRRIGSVEKHRYSFYVKNLMANYHWLGTRLFYSFSTSKAITTPTL